MMYEAAGDVAAEARKTNRLVEVDAMLSKPERETWLSHEASKLLRSIWHCLTHFVNCIYCTVSKDVKPLNADEVCGSGMHVKRTERAGNVNERKRGRGQAD